MFFKVVSLIALATAAVAQFGMNQPILGAPLGLNQQAFGASLGLNQQALNQQALGASLGLGLNQQAQNQQALGALGLGLGLNQQAQSQQALGALGLGLGLGLNQQAQSQQALGALGLGLGLNQQAQSQQALGALGLGLNQQALGASLGLGVPTTFIPPAMPSFPTPQGGLPAPPPVPEFGVPKLPPAPIGQYGHGPGKLTGISTQHLTKIDGIPEKIVIRNEHGQEVDVLYYTYPLYNGFYKVDDNHTGDHKLQAEERNGGRVKGFYTNLEPGGTIRRVDYYADNLSGFHANVNDAVNHVVPAKPHEPKVI